MKENLESLFQQKQNSSEEMYASIKSSQEEQQSVEESLSLARHLLVPSELQFSFLCHGGDISLESG